MTKRWRYGEKEIEIEKGGNRGRKSRKQREGKGRW